LQPDRFRIEGSVERGIEIGIDGRVEFVHGTGADYRLVESAGKNAKE
jgi:hypothetical protein